MLKNVVLEIKKLLEEADMHSQNAACGYDDGWYNGEVNAYENVLKKLENLTESSCVAELIKEVENLNDNTPNGVIHDADTILADIVENCDFEFTGISQDIFNIWKNSIDKKAVEQMFYEFTDIEFEEYLQKCKEEISRNTGSFTAFAYEDGGIVATDLSTYDTKEEAIEFAKNRNWDEVVNDITGEVVWKRLSISLD